jgi:hypothetical protein
MGVELSGPYFKGTLAIGSASANLKLPLDLTHGGAYIAGPLFGFLNRRDISEQALYTFSKSGLFLEAGVESEFSITRSLSCNLWMKSDWLRIRGDGEMQLNGKSSGFILGFAFPNAYSTSATGTSILSRYTFDLGISGTIRF